MRSCSYPAMKRSGMLADDSSHGVHIRSQVRGEQYGVDKAAGARHTPQTGFTAVDQIARVQIVLRMWQR